jgi:hypothetical protein
MLPIAHRTAILRAVIFASLSAGLGACSSPAAPQGGTGGSQGNNEGTGGKAPDSGGSSAQGGGSGAGMGGSATGGSSASGGSGGSASSQGGTTSGDGSGGSAGAPDAAGSGGAGPAPTPGDDAQGPPENPGAGGDETPDRPLNVDKANPQVYTIKFKPTDVDPGSTGKDETQTALVDTSKTIQKKLVIVLAGSNGAPGPIGVANFVAAQGFHAYAIAYHDEYDASTYRPPNAEVFTNSRYNELDGGGRKPSQVTVPRADCVEERMLKALPYLQTKNPQGDWAYYLQKDGKIRWSDVIFIGHSHGATSSAAFAKIRRVWRAISLSGPRDDNPVPATWLTMPSATPIERYYGFTGTADAQHQDHIKSMELQKYLGTLTSVEGAQPPYGDSHRLRYTGGHGDSANCNNFAAVCKYMLGVP